LSSAFRFTYQIGGSTPAGLEKIHLTNNPAIHTSNAWSPEGELIAFETDRDGDFEIYAMNASGSGQTNLTNNQAAYDISPAWSPDRTQIFFRCDHTGERFDHEAYVMNANGSHVTGVGLAWLTRIEQR
jgi:Tol biopolymer transport system component